MLHRKTLTTILLLLLVFGFVGCSRHPSLSGKVTFSDDGSPLTVGTVVFLSDTYTARGRLTSDGSFTVRSDTYRGIPPGTYRVYIEDAIRFDEHGRNVPLIDGKYFRPETSGLTITVDGSQTFDIVVERIDFVPTPHRPREIPGGGQSPPGG